MLTSRQASLIIIMYIFGSTLVFAIGVETGQDIWIAHLITLALTFPTVLMYSRIMSLYPQKDLFMIARELFGKRWGKIVTALVSCYALQLGSAVLRNFTDFIQVSTAPETPQLAMGLLMMTCTVYLTKSGVDTYGKWAAITFVIICMIVVLTFCASLDLIDPTHLLPVMSHSPRELLSAGYRQFALPFAETVLFLGIADSLKKGENPYKAYLVGILFAGSLSLLILLRNVTVLGPAMMQSAYFPSYVAAKLINIGYFLPRIESLISMNYLFAGITKVALCLFVSTKGISVVFDIGDFRSIVAPVGLTILATSATSFDSVMHLFRFVNQYYPIYAAPFQVVIPIIIWIAAEANARKKKAGKGKN